MDFGGFFLFECYYSRVYEQEKETKQGKIAENWQIVWKGKKNGEKKG